MEPIKILVVDDHKLFREGLIALLNAAPETAVVGEAATGAEAIAQAETGRAGRHPHGHSDAGHERH
jgi:DNA-binding NarL/FixJ family response regulator